MGSEAVQLLDVALQLATGLTAAYATYQLRQLRKEVKEEVSRERLTQEQNDS